MHDVVVFGAGGYAGLELVKLLALHDGVRMTAIASDALAGQPVRDHVGTAAGAAFVSSAQALDACAAGAAVALLAVPHEAAQDLALKNAAFGTRVVDLSNAHRAEPGVPYGLTSWFAGDVAGASLVANPGCYATAVITMLAPLVKAGAIELEVPVSAASGVTGAGKTLTAGLMMGEMFGDMRAYRVLAHQHVPEIERALGRIGDAKVRVILTTHLLPVARGILATATAKLTRDASAAELLALFEGAYAGDPFVTIAGGADRVSLRRAVGTNQVVIGLDSEGRAGGYVVITASLDNLVKGAAGQAIENMNLVLGLPRTAGLAHLARHS